MKQFLFCASLLLVFASCTKSSTSVVENDQILRSGKWRMTAYTMKFETTPGVDSVYNIFADRDTCRFDDFISFGDNYKGVQNTGEDKCSSELTEMPFDWKLMNNQSVLMLNNAQHTFGYTTSKFYIVLPGRDYVEAKISKLNKKTLTLTYETKMEVFVPAPPPAPGTFQERTFYFTQSFEK